MTEPQDDQPKPEGSSSADAKPNTPGAKEPETIAASILPQRLEDRARHPEPPEKTEAVAPLDVDDPISAAQEAVETIRSSEHDAERPNDQGSGD